MRTAILCALVAFSVVYAKPLKSEGKAECTQLCPNALPNQLNVHIVPHSHDDVGWLKTVDQYYYGLRNNIQKAGVQYIIDSVIAALQLNPERKFIQVETAFFHKWWKEQTPETQDVVKALVNSGQLEIAGGGWSMNDEAASHYHSVIDQFSFGLRVINDTLGECARPRVGWQIDPFGHSREMASIFAQMGFDGQFFARLDWRDKTNRMTTKAPELLWKASPNLGDSSNLFTSALYNHYSAPAGFCFDILCNDDPIITDQKSVEYNLEKKVVDFAEFVKKQAGSYLTNNIMITMGDDFNYQNAIWYFKNMDYIIRGFEQFPQQFNGLNIKLAYSSPSCYLKAVNDFAQQNQVSFPEKTDDFFPYASDYHAYWTGYYTSRPTSKRYERQGNNLLQVTKQLGSYSKLDQSDEALTLLKEAVGIMQHHDAITGTEKQHVADDYARILTEAVEGGVERSGQLITNLLNKTSSTPLQFTSCLLANVSFCETSKQQTFVVAIYNPLSQKSSEYVRLPVDTTGYTITGPQGESVPYQILPSISNFTELQDVLAPSMYDLVFKAENVPPHGIKLYHITISSSVNYPTPDTSNTKLTLGDQTFGLTVNDETGLLETVTVNSNPISVQQQLMYYFGARGDNSEFERRASGAYIFRPAPSEPDAIAFGNPSVTVYKGDLVEEVHQVFHDSARQILRYYKGSDYVELDWLVGPIEISDDEGREIISRFTTEVTSDDIFYTDSNGREMLERKRNFRPTFNYTNEEPVAGNYYPVTAKIAIKNEAENVEIAVLNDRAQGGSSLRSGEVELMLHRRLLDDDAFGVGEALNENQAGVGMIARGQLYLTVGEIVGERSPASVQRKIAERKLLQPWVFLANADGLSLTQIQDGYNMEFAGLTQDLPENVHILTLEPWDMQNRQLLLRLEHIFEKNEDALLSQDVTVDLTNAFSKIVIETLAEMTLDGNLPLSQSKRLDLNKADVRRTGDVKASEVTLSPMQIRTFVATVQFV